MRKLVKFFVIAAVVVFCGPMWADAQNIIHDLQPTSSEYSIIRNYKDGVDICFTVNTCQEYCFTYIDRNGGIIRKASFPCELLYIHDFQVMDGRVYFCAQSGLDAIIGWFDIAGVFFSGDSIHYKELTTNFSQNPLINGPDEINLLTRLKVTKCNGDIHMVMLGTGRTSDGHNIGTYSAIVDAWTTNLYDWTYEYSLDYYNTVCYDDLTITDNYVVVAAHKIDAVDYMGSCLFYYSLPTSSNQSIFYPLSSGYSPFTAPYSQTSSSIIYCNVFHPQHITNLGGDSIAVVCDAVAGSSYETVVSLYANPSTAPFSRFSYVPAGSYNYGYKEIAFDKIKQSLLMLLNQHNILECYNLINGYVDVYETNTDYIWMSLDDTWGKGGAILSGTNPMIGAMLSLWRFGENIDACVNSYQINITPINKGVTRKDKTLFVEYYLLRIGGFVPNISSHTFNVECHY